MQFVKETFTNTLEVKQSKFIAYLIPFSDYNQKLTLLKDEHPKARHFVVAYRYLNEFHQIVEHSSDDGEPKGTSGKPSLIVLQGQGLINSAVIIVRYFGGTKLGTGGLVRAYGEAVNLVIDKSELFEYIEQETLKVSFSYTDNRMIDYACEELEIKIVEKQYNLDVVYHILGSQESIKVFKKRFERKIIEL